jgi:hemerythrin
MGIYWINEDNIPGIEYEPEKLINILTNLQTAEPGSDTGELVQTTLNKLRMYTRVYFSIEEQIMIRYAYPEMDSHLEEHAHLTSQVERLIDQNQSGQQPPFGELLAFLTEWQENHTRITDQKLSNFITRGVPICIAQYA